MPFRNLYVHVPFCSVKCDYCAFFPVEHYGPDLHRKWLECVLRGLDRHADELETVETVYFGGGTPTLPDADFLDGVFRAVFERIRMVPGAEVTSEANPETITPEKAAVLASHVNRVSMGVQSFDPVKRAVLGRHPASADSVPRAAELLREAGIRNLGFDLMYAVPGETPAGWRRDLELALELKPDHLSAYALTPEEHTPYARAHGLRAADDALSDAMWRTAGEMLAGAGLPRYEISNYAGEAFQARHNCAVWHGQTYLGLGPSACSFDGTDRFTEPAGMKEWLEGVPPAIDRIPRAARRREILMMGLRTVRGWGRDEFASAAGSGWEDALPVLHELEKDRLIELSDAFCRPTQRGLAFWNEIAERLIL